MKIIDICPYMEWIELEVNGVEKVFNFYNTNDINIKAFYLDEALTDRYLFNEVTREITKY